MSSLATRRAASRHDSSKIRQRRSREKDRAARKAGAVRGPGFFAAFYSQSMMARRDQGTVRRGQMQAAATRGATDRPGQESSGNERDTSDTLPDLLPCRGNGFPAIRRRLTHGRVRYNTDRQERSRVKGSRPRRSEITGTVGVPCALSCSWDRHTQIPRIPASRAPIMSRSQESPT